MNLDLMAPPDLGGMPPALPGEIPPVSAGPDLGEPPVFDMGLPPAPGGEMDMAGLPPAPEMEMGLPPSLDAGLPPPPGAEFGMGMEMGPAPDMALAPPSLDAGLALPGMTGAADKLRLDLPQMPTDVPLKNGQMQDLPTLDSSAKRPSA